MRDIQTKLYQNHKISLSPATVNLHMHGTLSGEFRDGLVRRQLEEIENCGNELFRMLRRAELLRILTPKIINAKIEQKDTTEPVRKTPAIDLFTLENLPIIQKKIQDSQQIVDAEYTQHET